MAAIRRRIYNPAHLTPDELKESFVAREDTLAELLRVIREQTAGRPCQHMMLIGPRGMGKTTLGLRLLYAVEEDPDLRARWQPVAFHEESYGIAGLADFWFHALRHLTRATGESRWEERAEALLADEGDLERAAAYALAELMDFSRENGKRLILFVENLDGVIGQIHDERDIHSLRATLIERPEILLLGSANAFFDAIGGYGEPLYEFFRVFKLDGIGQEEARRILEAAASSEGRPEVSKSLNMEQGRLETIRRLTGGNPRLLSLACRLLIESPLGSAVEDLERLIDEQTPYFKARIEDLPGQARKVFHCLSEGWKPLLAKEVAATANLSSSHASAQLKQLLEKGYTREIRLPGAKRTRYEVSDRFYNIYYLLRFSRAGRDRLERLVEFLHDLFGPTGMRVMYPAILASMRGNGSPAGEAPAWLGVLASRVARDQGFDGREQWLREARDLVVKMVGPSSAAVREIQQEVDDCRRVDECLQRGREFMGAGRLAEAEATFREVLAIHPDDGRAWMALGFIMALEDHPEDAIDSLQRVTDHTSSDDSANLGTSALRTMVFKAFALLQLERYEEFSITVAEVLTCANSEDVTEFRQAGALMSWLHGNVLTDLNRPDDAIAAWQRTADLVCGDDPEMLRHRAVEAIAAKASALSGTGRDDAAIVTWEQATAYVGPDDPVEMRDVVARALFTKGYSLAIRNRFEEAIASWERISDFVRMQDPAELRHLAVNAANVSAVTRFDLGRQEDFMSMCKYTVDHVRKDDSKELRHLTANTLSVLGNWLNLRGRHSTAGALCRTATDIDPETAESWRVLAESILGQDDSGCLPEAEECAQRAVSLAPTDYSVLHTLSDVLARGGKWTDALSRLEQALRVGRGQSRETERPRLAQSMIRAVAAGHAGRVKQMMEEAGLVESMEPLWHAVRVELGEELESLPAEILDAVSVIREIVADFHKGAPSVRAWQPAPCSSSAPV